MIARIALVDSRSQDGDGSSAGFQGATVCGRINTPGKSRNNGHATLRQIAGKHQGRILAVGRTAARTDQGNAGLIQALCPRAFYIEDDRRVVNLTQERRINAVVEHEQVTAQITNFLNLDFRFRVEVSGDNAVDGFGQNSQLGQFAARRAVDRLSRAEAFQQFGGGARPDAGGHVECYPVTHTISEFSQIAECGILKGLS
jgi:hypothetical protein